MSKTMTVQCEVHGEQTWEGHIKCNQCGAAYTTTDESLATHAPPRCRSCGVRLVPFVGASMRRKDRRFSMEECCPKCFGDAPASMRGVHDRADPQCRGEACPAHGPMLLKLKRRAARAAAREARS